MGYKEGGYTKLNGTKEEILYKRKYYYYHSYDLYLL